jgi:hypothetical protein
MWEDFKQLASQNNATATDLIISFIETCLQSQSIPQSRNNIDSSPQPNLDDIYKYIDDKLDNLEDVSIQDIDNKIAESLEYGDIKDAIANSYARMMGQFNGLFSELQALQKQVEELQSNPPALVPQSPITNEELTTDNEQLTKDDGQMATELESDRNSTENPSLTEEQIIKLFGLESIATGTPYKTESLESDGVFDRFAQNQGVLLSLGIKYREGISPVNNLLKKLNFTITKHKDKRTYHTSKE